MTTIQKVQWALCLIACVTGIVAFSVMVLS